MYQLSYKNLAGKQVYQESSTWRSFCLIQYQFLAHSGVTVREDTARWREDINLLSGCVGHKRSQGGWPTPLSRGKCAETGIRGEIEMLLQWLPGTGKDFQPLWLSIPCVPALACPYQSFNYLQNPASTGVWNKE